MMSFSDFVHNYGLRNKSASILKIQNILISLASKDVRIFLGNGTFSGDLGIVNIHPTKGTHWVA